MASDGLPPWPASARLEKIPLDRIDASDQRYRIRTPAPVKPLARSISAAGLLVPPILLDRGPKGRLVVVSGFRRIEALKGLAIRELDARILPEHTPPLHCAVISVAENTLGHPLDPMESARCLALLSNALRQPERLAAMAADLGLDVHPARIGKLLDLLRLPQPVQNAVSKGVVSAEVALELGRLDGPDAEAMADLFIRLQPSLGKQREILVLCREIARREGIRVQEVLSLASVRSVLDGEEPDGNAKTAALRKRLRELRFPAMSRAEGAFEARRKSLKLPPQIQLTPPAQFEGRSYRLTLAFDSLMQLEGHRDTLTRILAEPALQEILDRSS